MASGLELTTLEESLPLKFEQTTTTSKTEQLSHVSSKSKFKRSIKNDVETCMLFDSARVSQLLNAIERTSGSIDGDNKAEAALQSSSSFSKTVCSVCGLSFISHHEQSSHFKSEWHQVNVRRQLRSAAPLNEAEFAELQLGNDSSSSGSETLDSETDSSDDRIISSASDAIVDLDENLSVGSSRNLRNQSQHVFFTSSSGEQLSVNRCLVSNILKEHKLSDKELCEEINKLSANMCWVILMASGGHFAGAVFDGPDVVQHKTFHRYVVRAKRGTCQSHCDNKGGNAPKSAGASLRRYNEAAFAQEIHDLLSSWADDLARASRIFLRAPGHNRSFLFGGKSPVLCKTDPRLCAISVKTNRPTFREVKRVHRLIATIQVIDEKPVLHNDVEKLSTNCGSLLPMPQSQNAELSSNSVDESGHVTSTSTSDSHCNGSMDTSGRVTDSTLSASQTGSSSPPDFHTTSRAVVAELELSVPEAGDFDNSTSRCSSILPESTNVDVACEDIGSTFNKLYTACKMGLTDQVSALLQESDTECVINQQTGKQSSTLLHVTSKAGHVAIVRLLLEHGADPAVRDANNNPPYVVGSKEVKNEYRRFMADNMDLYDYTRAQIPGPLTDEMEAERKLKDAAKKKAKRNAKKEKEKEIKEAEKKAEQEMEIKRLEESKKQAFLALSDREKRALAAEQRLKIQLAQTCSSSVRCWQCGLDITGKIPFEYSDCKFCSPACLRTHRLAST